MIHQKPWLNGPGEGYCKTEWSVQQNFAGRSNVGSSGSGKTTLMKLLQRLYIPQSGRILVDGINIAQVDPTWLRRHMGVVLQDAMLFNRSIRDNIAIRNPGASFATVEAVARLAGADDFIRALPHAYDSVVGERGCLLSAG